MRNASPTTQSSKHDNTRDKGRLRKHKRVAPVFY